MTSNKRDKASKISAETEKIIELLKLSVPGTEIAKRLGCRPSRVYSIKSYHKKDIELAQTINNHVDISNYDEQVKVILKNNIIKLGNNINNINIEKASLSQVSTAFGIMFDKLRLIEGKSTANIGVNILASLNPESIDILQESIKSLKKSMLNQD